MTTSINSYSCNRKINTFAIKYTGSLLNEKVECKHENNDNIV